MKRRVGTMAAAFVVCLAFVVGACQDATVTPTATVVEVSEDVVEALATAYAAHTGRTSSVGIALESLDNVPDPQLAEGMLRVARDAPTDVVQVLEFVYPDPALGFEEQLVARIVDSEDPWCCAIFAVDVRKGGIGWEVGDAKLVGYATMTAVEERVAAERDERE